MRAKVSPSRRPVAAISIIFISLFLAENQWSPFSGFLLLNHRSHVEKFCRASCSLKNATRRPILFIRRLWLYRSQSTVCCQSHINSSSSLSNLRPFHFLVYSCMCPLPMLLFSLRLLIFFLTRPPPFQPILTSELKKNILLFNFYCLTFMKA